MSTISCRGQDKCLSAWLLGLIYQTCQALSAAGAGCAERCARVGAQAGLLIAETEFALQVESDIAPYKGLLMGLFFMTVGMEISAGLFFAKLRTVLAAIAVLLIGKVRTPLL